MGIDFDTLAQSHLFSCALRVSPQESAPGPWLPSQFFLSLPPFASHSNLGLGECGQRANSLCFSDSQATQGMTPGGPVTHA